jgi:hypothetical protein
MDYDRKLLFIPKAWTSKLNIMFRGLGKENVQEAFKDFEVEEY